MKTTHAILELFMISRALSVFSLKQKLEKICPITIYYDGITSGNLANKMWH